MTSGPSGTLETAAADRRNPDAHVRRGSRHDTEHACPTCSTGSASCRLKCSGCPTPSTASLPTRPHTPTHRWPPPPPTTCRRYGSGGSRTASAHSATDRRAPGVGRSPRHTPTRHGAPHSGYASAVAVDARHPTVAGLAGHRRRHCAPPRGSRRGTDQRSGRSSQSVELPHTHHTCSSSTRPQASTPGCAPASAEHSDTGKYSKGL